MPGKRHGQRRRAVALALVLAGCSSSARSPAPTSPTADDGPAVADFAGAHPGQPGCRPASPLVGHEVLGSVDDGSVYGLLFVEPPIAAGEEVKIVWRMTGRGALQIEARQDRTAATLTFGPEAHGSSNWHRPGAEWGTGFVFPTRGCWDIRLRRDDVVGHVWIDVVG